MLNREAMIEKYYLKEKALELQKRGKLTTFRFLKARDFLNELLENPLFENDYFVYRRLTMLYSDNGHIEDEYKIIKSFFKSGIYCHSYQVLWFKNKFKALVRQNYATQEELEELENYYNQNSIKNKSKVNEPTFIAERIYKIKGNITAILETEYNAKQFRFELVENAREYNRVGKYDEAIDIYKDLIYNRKKRHFDYYLQLAVLYRKTGQIEEEFNIIDEYINENPYKREEKIELFSKRLDNLGDYSFSGIKKENIDKNPTNDGFIDFLLKNGPSADISEFNKESNYENEIYLDDELLIEDDFEEDFEFDNNNSLEQYSDIENSSDLVNTKETYDNKKGNDSIIKSSIKGNYLSSFSQGKEMGSTKDFIEEKNSEKISDNKNKSQKSKTREFIEAIAPYYGIENVFSHILQVDEKYEVQENFPLKLYEYDSALTFEENLYRKVYLKQYGKSLKKKYDEVIAFYESLLNNGYFQNDWYLYRQLYMNYNFKKSFEDCLKTVKNVFYADIYLNEYQMTWFTNKIRLLEEHLEIDMDKIESWLDYYQNHGAKNNRSFSKDIPYADACIYYHGEICVYSKESFDLVQDIYCLIETGRILEDKDQYEMAIKFYLDKIENGYPIYDFYKRICLCLEKLEDYETELEYIKFYYSNKPIDNSYESQIWFKNRLKKVNSKLGTNYVIQD